MTPEEQIRANAELIVKEFSPISGLGAAFGYNRASVAWLDGYIERARDSGSFSESQIESLAQCFSCFLGECIRNTYGGDWHQRDGSWGIFFRDSSGAFPFSKVRKQFDDGSAAGESILSFFDVLPIVLSGKLDKQNQSLFMRMKAILRRCFVALRAALDRFARREGMRPNPRSGLRKYLGIQNSSGAKSGGHFLSRSIARRTSRSRVSRTFPAELVL